MNSLRYHILGCLVATVILFVWGAAIHMGLANAIEAKSVLSDSQERQLVETMQEPAVALQDGIYVGSRGLFLVVSTLADGTDTFSGMSFAKTLVIQLLICALVGLLLSIIVGQLPGTSVRQRALLLALMGLSAGIFTCLPQWIWYGFGPRFTAVDILDIAGGWFLSGLALAWLANRRSTAAVETST